MGVAAPEPSLRWAREWMFRRFLKRSRLRRCLTIDEPLYEYLRQDTGASRKVAYLPDAVSEVAGADSEHARARLGLPPGDVVVLVFGSLSRRKGLPHIVPSTDRVHVLVAGRLDADMVEWLALPVARTLRDAGRLHVLDGWCDARREADAFAASDVMWMGYDGHAQSSGVLIQAGRAGLPVIACDEGIIGWFTRRHSTGLVVNVRDHDTVATAIAQLVRDPGLRRRLGENGRRATRGHTTERAIAVIDEALRS
jgi:glycosyltransferase involved in cell wall biosynthesis